MGMAERMQENVELKLFVRGDVHGVGYRYFCQQLAGKLLLTGYAKNVNGGVEVLVCGSEEGTQKFLEELKKTKPPTATVESIEVASRKNISRQPLGFKIC